MIHRYSKITSYYKVVFNHVAAMQCAHYVLNLIQQKRLPN